MYYAIVEWWDSVKEEDIFSHVLIFAEDYAEAMELVVTYFDEIDSVDIRLIRKEQRDIVYLPPDCALAVKEENIW